MTKKNKALIEPAPEEMDPKATEEKRIFDGLAAPFSQFDLEWRVMQAGAKRNGDCWAKVVAYVTSRAIMDRLDDIMGPTNWKNDVENINGAFISRLSLRVNGEWITKTDGADETKVEGTKGGISGALKRSAVLFKIGRYLYTLSEYWAEIDMQGGENYQPAKNGKYPAFRWNPPQLPDYALPENERVGAPPQPGQLPAAKETKPGNAKENKNLNKIVADTFLKVYDPKHDYLEVPFNNGTRVVQYIHTNLERAPLSVIKAAIDIMNHANNSQPKN